MRKKNFITLLVALFFVNGLFAQQPRIRTILDEYENHPEHILVTAHRAAHKNCPENSLASLKEAIRLGADIVEIDLRETKDHQLVILHDESIDRVTNGKGLVREMTLKELKGKRLLYKGAVTDQEILTFSEALDVLKGEMLINLDYKAGGNRALRKAYKLIKEKGMENQILFYIYANYDLIPKLRRINPKVKIMPRAYSTEDVKKILAIPGIDIIQIDFSFYDDEWTKDVIEKGIRISGNSVEKYDNMQIENGTGYDELTKMNINIIETDEPEELLNYLKKKGFHL